MSFVAWHLYFPASSEEKSTTVRLVPPSGVETMRTRLPSSNSVRSSRVHLYLTGVVMSDTACADSVNVEPSSRTSSSDSVVVNLVLSAHNRTRFSGQTHEKIAHLRAYCLRQSDSTQYIEARCAADLMPTPVVYIVSLEHTTICKWALLRLP